MSVQTPFKKQLKAVRLSVIRSIMMFDVVFVDVEVVVIVVHAG